MHAKSIRTQAFTLVELLLAGALLVVLLTVMGTYLAEQTELDRSRQAHAEAQDKARLVMQLVTQDLQLSGAKKYVDSTGVVDEAASLSACASATCLQAADGAATDDLYVQYVTTLREPAAACRKVGYHVEDGGATLTLWRADVLCSAVTDHVDWTTNSAMYDPLATGVLALDTKFECSSGVPLDGYPNSTACPASTTYVRSAVVTVVAVSDTTISGRGGETHTTATNENVTCPDDRVCYTLEQEILMPNLKDG